MNGQIAPPASRKEWKPNRYGINKGKYRKPGQASNCFLRKREQRWPVLPVRYIVKLAVEEQAGGYKGKKAEDNAPVDLAERYIGAKRAFHVENYHTDIEMIVDMFSMRPIGYVRSPYKDTREIPKGLGAKHHAEGILEINQEFEPGLKDIEGFSHLIVIWAFDRSNGFELVASPPSDNRQHGVFATRSPKRPNPIGLTTVELLQRDDTQLRVRGVDMLDGTAILDLKPYLSSVPSDQLRRGWLAEAEARKQSPSK